MRVYGIVGWKNGGKTTLVERLVAELTARGHSVSTVKHAHHGFDIDQPGRDSWRHRAAGAREVLVASARRWALMAELGAGEREPSLEVLLQNLSPVDLVLVEGYKRDCHPKIEAWRPETGQSPIARNDPSIRAIACHGDPGGSTLPRFDLDDIGGIADFVLHDSANSAAGPTDG